MKVKILNLLPISSNLIIKIGLSDTVEKLPALSYFESSYTRPSLPHDLIISINGALTKILYYNLIDNRIHTLVYWSGQVVFGDIFDFLQYPDFVKLRLDTNSHIPETAIVRQQHRWITIGEQNVRLWESEVNIRFKRLKTVKLLNDQVEILSEPHQILFKSYYFNNQTELDANITNKSIHTRTVTNTAEVTLENEVKFGFEISHETEFKALLADSSLSFKFTFETSAKEINKTIKTETEVTVSELNLSYTVPKDSKVQMDIMDTFVTLGIPTDLVFINLDDTEEIKRERTIVKGCIKSYALFQEFK